MHKIILFFLFIFPLTSFSQQSFFYVETKDSLPYLNYGLGKDRLGGAKMTFLDSNVILKVVDSFGTQYKVQLSEQHSAWIEKQNVERTEGEFLPQYISGNWRVEGDSAFDYVAVSLPQRLPYNSRMDIDPAKIVVDIFGVTSNTNWITQMPTTREIKNVWYVQREDDVMEVNIELKHKTQWGYHIYYDSLNRLTIRVNRQPSSLLLRKMIIAVDAGHGGENTGATGVNTGIIEKDYTLLYAEELKKQLLAKKVKVVMTREKDTTLSMFERIRFLQQEQPDLLVSIHFNSASIDTVHGVSTYYRYVGFRPLSQFILKRMMAIGLNDFGNVGSFNFSLSGPTEFPNCLVEVAFLSNPQDEKKIRSVVFRRKVAQQIILGITDFLNSLK